MDGFIKAFFEFGSHHGAGHKDAIDFWVAVGTVLSAAATAFLALITVISVAYSGRTLRGESRRHQQQFAPILMLKPHRTFHALDGFDVVNVGLGPALGCGLALLFDSFLNEIDKVKINTTIYRPTLVQSNTWEMRFTQNQDEFEGHDLFDPEHTFGTAFIHYNDIFGNSYWTQLPIITSGNFPKWIPAEALFGRQKDGINAVTEFVIQRYDKRKAQEDLRRAREGAKLAKEQLEQSRKALEISTAQLDAIRNDKNAD